MLLKEELGHRATIFWGLDGDAIFELAIAVLL